MPVNEKNDLQACGPVVVHVLTAAQSIPFVEGLVCDLASQGYRPLVVTSPGPALDALSQRHGVEVSAVSMSRRISPLADLRALFELIQLFRKRRPRLVHSHTPKAGLLGILAARLAGVPARIYQMRGLVTLTATGLRRHLLQASERWSCRLAQVVVCQSPSLRSLAIDQGIVAAGKIRILANGSNGVDAAGRFDPDAAQGRGRTLRRSLGIGDDAVCVGFIGRVVRDKGIMELVEAWQRVREQHPTAQLLIAGPAEPGDRIPESVASRLEADEGIHMLGEVADIVPCYDALNLVVLPSRREGFPNVLLEAAAMSLPVVATRSVGCVDAVVEGETGTLVDIGDPELLATAISTYIEKPQLRRRHGSAGRERVLRDFQPKAVRRAAIELYVELGAQPEGTLDPPGTLLTRALKRGLDIAAATLGLVALAPLMFCLALAVRVTLGFPILFRHTRPGRFERAFVLRKFRTMRQPAPNDDGVWFRTDEQRLTGLGRFLRRTSLDELPQLWNVLRGEMSLVGPRPLLMEYLPKYTPEQRRRHAVRPGLTGLAAVSGRHTLRFSQRLRLDVEYVDRWSLGLDLRILARTAATLFVRSDVRATPDIEAVDDIGLTPDDDDMVEGPQ